MPDVYENPFTAALLDFFENQQNARKKAPWASETPATWSDGTPIGDAPELELHEALGPHEGFERTRNTGFVNPLYMPYQQVHNLDIDQDWSLKNSLAPSSITGWEHDPTIPDIEVAMVSPDDGYTSSHWLDLEDVGRHPHHYDFALGAYEGGAVDPAYYDSIMEAYRLYGDKLPIYVDAPFYEAMLEEEYLASLLDDYGIGPEEFVPELPVSKFTTDFRTDPSFLKLDSVDDALLMGSPYGADDYLAGLSSFTPGKMPVNAMDDVFGLAKNSAKAGKRAGSGLAASFRKLKNII